MFFFTQKTAYEILISDWSSDVCSSDLVRALNALTVRSASIPLMVAGRVPFNVSDAAVFSGFTNVIWMSLYLDVYAAKFNRTRRSNSSVFRSEEHTSELQSLMRISYAVFCLKKKTTTTNKILIPTEYVHK